MDQYDGYNNIRSFFSNWLKLWYFWNKTRWARSRVCKPKLRQERISSMLVEFWYLAVLQTTLENLDLDCKFLKELNLVIIRTMTNGSLLMVQTQLSLSSWIWSIRLTLRPISKVLNVGCEGVSIFICNTMQHVRANKELSIFY